MVRIIFSFYFTNFHHLLNFSNFSHLELDDHLDGLTFPAKMERFLLQLLKFDIHKLIIATITMWDNKFAGWFAVCIINVHLETGRLSSHKDFLLRGYLHHRKVVFFSTKGTNFLFEPHSIVLIDVGSWSLHWWTNSNKLSSGHFTFATLGYNLCL